MPPSGASDGEYRGLAVSQAEAVLEPPPPPPVAPQQHAGGLDLHPSLQPQVHAHCVACSCLGTHAFANIACRHVIPREFGGRCGGSDLDYICDIVLNPVCPHDGACK